MPGSFRSAQAQAATGQATLTFDDRPPVVPVEEWLAPGEWIRYWSEMPYGFTTLVAEAATVAKIDTGTPADDGNPMNREQRRARRNRGNSQPVKMTAEFKPSRATLATFVLGLVDWSLRDEKDQPVPFVPFDLEGNWMGRAQALQSALPIAVVEALGNLIDAAAKPPLDMKAPDAEHGDDTVGNDSAEL